MLDWFSPVPLAPNAGAHLLPEAAARHERRLEAVSCTPLFGQVKACRTRAIPPYLA